MIVRPFVDLSCQMLFPFDVVDPLWNSFFTYLLFQALLLCCSSLPIRRNPKFPYLILKKSLAPLIHHIFNFWFLSKQNSTTHLCLYSLKLNLFFGPSMDFPVPRFNNENQQKQTGEATGGLSMEFQPCNHVVSRVYMYQLAITTAFLFALFCVCFCSSFWREGSRRSKGKGAHGVQSIFHSISCFVWKVKGSTNSRRWEEIKFFLLWGIRIKKLGNERIENYDRVKRRRLINLN